MVGAEPQSPPHSVSMDFAAAFSASAVKSRHESSTSSVSGAPLTLRISRAIVPVFPLDTWAGAGTVVTASAPAGGVVSSARGTTHAGGARSKSNSAPRHAS